MSLSAWTRALIISATIILVGVIIVGVVWLLSWVRNILLLVLLAALLSSVLMPLVDWLGRFKAIPRPLAVLICYVGVLIVFGGLLSAVIPPLVDQANQLVQGLPDIFRRLTSPDSVLTQTLERFGINPSSSGGSLGAQIQEVARAVLTNLATVVRDITTVAVGIIVVLVVSFYLLNEGHDFRAKLERVVPEAHRSKVDFVTESATTAVAGYVRAQLAVAVMVGVLAGFAAWAIGIRYPLIIGVLAGVFELVPFFGPTLGAIPAVLIAAFQGDWIRLALIVGAFIVIQQIESNLIGPRIMAHGVGLHPLVVILAVLIGIEVAGIWGALFAVPGAAVLVAVGRRVYQVRQEKPRRLAA
ncbi:MAG TPA: AI-2E family transporter [Chloroflexota bacterium]|nr:AI-2E family transporter [Chloroflexota bacterium]